MDDYRIILISLPLRGYNYQQLYIPGRFCISSMLEKYFTLNIFIAMKNKTNTYIRKMLDKCTCDVRINKGYKDKINSLYHFLLIDHKKDK